MTAAPSKLSFAIKLTIKSGPQAGTILDFDKESVAVGRGPENDIVLSLDAKVSRQHGEFRRSEEGWKVVNLSAKNYILINGERHPFQDLKPGDKVQFGDTLIVADFEEQIEPEVAQEAPAMPFPVRVPPIAPVAPIMSAPPAPTAFTPPAVGQTPQYPLGQVNTSGSGGIGARPVGGSAWSQMDPGKQRFYIIVGVLLLGFLWLMFSDTKAPPKDTNAVRSADQIKMDLATTEKTIGQLKEEEERRRSIQYKKAQENLVRGFRDFQQGQYARARDSFQVVLNMDPENELAQRYVQLAQIKFDQQIKQLMLQGARNREKLNWRLCMDAFSKVMTMLQGRRDNPTYIEAQKYFEACRLEAEGKY